MSIIKRPEELEVTPEIKEQAEYLIKQSPSRWPADEKAQKYAMFMKAYQGWSPEQTYTSILNYGYSQVNDFVNDADKSYGRMFERGIERELGQIANALNPNKAANSVADPTPSEMAKYKESITSGIKNLKQLAKEKGDLLTPEFSDKLNGAIAGAAKYFGKDFVQNVGGFQGGGTTNKITVDYIGQQTGTSQPQTFEIDLKTGAIKGGEISKPQGNYDEKKPGTPSTASGTPGSVQVINNGKSVIVNGKQYSMTSPVVQRYLTNPLNDNEKAIGQAIQQQTGNFQYSPNPTNPSNPTATGGGNSPTKGQTKSIGGALYTDNGNGFEASYTLNGVTTWVSEAEVQAAGSIAKAAQAKNSGGGTAPGTPGSPATPGNPGGSEAVSGSIDDQKRLEEALKIIDSSDLPPELKTLYKQTVKEWPAGQEINVAKILEKFNEIKGTTIDPYFKSVVDFATNSIQQSVQFQQQQRETQLEEERAVSGQNIRQAKAGLEQAGMTFTGKGVQELGAGSAYAQDGASAIPKQEPFGGMFYEGNVNQQNRLMATSSLANYNRNLGLLGQEAEAKLGTQGALGMNIPGFGAVGGQTGSYNQQKNQAYGTALGQLINQQQANVNQSQDYNYSLPVVQL